MAGCDVKEILSNRRIITEGINRAIVNTEARCSVGSITPAPSLPITELGTKQQWTIVPSLVDARGIDPDDFGETADPPQGSWNDADADRIFEGVGGIAIRLLYMVTNSSTNTVAVGFCNHDDETSDIGDLAHFSTVTFREGGTGTPVVLTRASASTGTDTVNGILFRFYTQIVAGSYTNFGTGSDPNSTVDIA